jgi:hypothetical protein
VIILNELNQIQEAVKTFNASVVFKMVTGSSVLDNIVLSIAGSHLKHMLLEKLYDFAESFAIIKIGKV